MQGGLAKGFKDSRCKCLQIPKYVLKFLYLLRFCRDLFVTSLKNFLLMYVHCTLYTVQITNNDFSFRNLCLRPDSAISSLQFLQVGKNHLAFGKNANKFSIVLLFLLLDNRSELSQLLCVSKSEAMLIFVCNSSSC